MSLAEDVVRVDEDFSDSDIEFIFEKCFPDEKRTVQSADKGFAEQPSIVCVLCDCLDCRDTEARDDDLGEPVLIEDSDEEEATPALDSRGEQLSFTIDDTCKAVFDRIDLESRVQEVWALKSSSILDSIEALQKDVRDMGEGLHASMQSLYQSYRPTTLQLPPIEFVDVPYSPTYSGDVLQRKCDNSSLHKSPNIGDKFFFETDSHQSHPEWEPGTIEQILNVSVGSDSEKRYVVKGDLQNKIVSTAQLAYYEILDNKLCVGSRIVAVHPKNIVSGYHSGMVAELPSDMNKHRYLVFYNCGPSLYVLPSDIRQVLESEKEPHEYFNKDSQKFIKMYLSSFPDRFMLDLKLQEIVKTSHKGAWYNARVIKVDASLVKILFLDGTSEWLYRGSTRFFPVLVKTPKKVLSHGTMPRPNISSYVQYELLSDGEEYNLSNSTRSVSKPSCNAVNLRKRNCKEGQHFVKHKRRSSRLHSGRVVRKYPQGIVNPRIKTPHTCTYTCANWLSFNKEEISRINPLTIPSVFGFKRKVEGTSVIYVSPCGKKLSNYDEVLLYISETKLDLSVDLFTFDPKVRIFDEFIVASEYILFEDVSRGNEVVPIPCVNIYDHTLPDLMEYMTERRSLEGVKLNINPEFLFGCDCTDNCSDKSKCACWQQTIRQAKEFDLNIDPDKIGYRYKKLPEMLLTGIYECNTTCKCNKSCLNRVVQHPMQLKLQLFKTKKKGWGTRCVNDVAAGTFICLYVGNILNEQQANQTGKAYGDEYFAELDYIDVLENHKNNFEEFPPELEEEFKNQKRLGGNRGSKFESLKNNQQSFSLGVDCNQNNQKFPSVRSYFGPNESVYIMDTKNAGNIGRFLNHSCDPNTFVQNVFVDTHDLRFPWVSFFALKYIPAGTELTWNYGYDVDSVPGKKIYCYCEAPNCRKRLL